MGFLSFSLVSASFLLMPLPYALFPGFPPLLLLETVKRKS
jgi:hypothetical protein